MKVAVIGAGPAGLSAAYNLAQRGLKVDLFEAGDSVGGLARSLELWGHRVDLGPHRFFSSDLRVNRLWLEVVGGDYRMVRRRTRILTQGRFFHYPLRLGNVLANLGPLESLRCLFSYVAQVWRRHPLPDTFEGWVVQHFGWRLYEIFFKTYSEKLWGLAGCELDSDFAIQRIKKLSFASAIQAALRGGQNLSTRTLVNEFAYPLRGTGMVYERMADRIQEIGGSVKLRSPVTRVLLTEGKARGLVIRDQIVSDYDHLVSTMPLTMLVEGLDAPEAVKSASRALLFRNTILIFLKVDSADLFPDNWLYVHSPALKLGRVTNFRNWVPELCQNQPGSVLSLEYWCNDQDALWSAPREELSLLARSELQATGLLKGATVEGDHVVRLPRCYPVYSRGYRRQIKTIRSFLSGIDGLSVIGRYGSFKYNNQDHSLLMGLLAAQNICDGAEHDLWEINSDTEYFERSRIAETGLVQSI